MTIEGASQIIAVFLLSALIYQMIDITESENAARSMTLLILFEGVAVCVASIFLSLDKYMLCLKIGMMICILALSMYFLYMCFYRLTAVAPEEIFEEQIPHVAVVDACIIVLFAVIYCR